MTYVDSHKAPGKGRLYERVYATDPVLAYLWAREQVVLDSILAEFYGGTPVDLLDFACGTGRVAGALENRVRWRRASTCRSRCSPSRGRNFVAQS